MDNYIGQIMLVAGTYAPKGWLECNGQLMSINQNQALFSLLGTAYGGDGITTFALPDLRGRAAVSWGQGPVTSLITRGQKYGSETVTLSGAQLPPHTHALSGQVTVNLKVNGSDDEESNSPVGKYLRRTPGTSTYANTANAVMGDTPATTSITPGGSGAPFPNLQPTLTMIYCIATNGLYPPRN